MKKKNYLFKGVTTDVLRIWTKECNTKIKEYIERIELIDVKVKLTSLEAMIARKKLNDFNKKRNTKLRLLKMKD